MKLIFSMAFVLLLKLGLAQSADTLSSSIIRENLLALGDRADMSFLDSTLQDVEIVLLGEQGHGDGSTFEVKTKMIRYLHEQMGFNVLAFESGLIDAYRTWEAIQAGADSVGIFNRGLFPVWTRSEQVTPLFEYILEQAKTETPLVLIGFDMQPTGSTHQAKDRFLELDDYLNKLLGEDWPDDYPLLPDYFQNTRQLFFKRPEKEQMAQFTNEMKKLQKHILKHDQTVMGQLMSRSIGNYFDTIMLYLKADMQNPSNTPHVFNLRDKRMAENFGFVKEVMFPGEKIIGWGANTHFGYGRGLLGTFNGNEAPEQGMVPMGQYLKIEYGSRLFTTAFTSAGGTYGSLRGGVTQLPDAVPGSLEHFLKQMEIEQAFINLRNGVLSNMQFPARMYGHSEMMGKWGQMADGIYFINQMEGSRFKQ